MDAPESGQTDLLHDLTRTKAADETTCACAKAFNMAVDKVRFSRSGRKVTKNRRLRFVPTGIFSGLSARAGADEF